MSIYVISGGLPNSSNGIVVTAGWKGFEVVGFGVITTRSAATFTIYRASSVSGGSAWAITPLREGDPAALSTALWNPTHGDTAQLGQWTFPANSDTPSIMPFRYREGERPWVSPGSSLSFDCGGASGVMANIYIREC